MATGIINVVSIESRTANTKNGPKPVYMLVADDGGKYNFGFKNPASLGIAPGMAVQGNIESDRFGAKMDDKTARVLGPSGAAHPATEPAMEPAKPGSSSFKAGGGGRERVFPIPPTSGEMAIIRQNSLTNAVATVARLWPSEKTFSDVEPKDVDSLVELVIRIAYRYAAFSSGQRDLETETKLASMGVLPGMPPKPFTLADPVEGDVEEGAF